MFNFRAYFYGNDVYINEKYRFDSNEILTAYLNDKYYDHLVTKDFIYYLKYFKRHLLVAPDMDYEDYISYNDIVYKSVDFTDSLNEILKKLPPYNKIFGEQITRLDDILNIYGYFFEDGLDPEDYTYGQFDENTVNEYGIGEKNDIGNYSMRLFKFQLSPPEHIDMEDDDTRHSLHELNHNISAFFDFYIGFVTTYLQVNEVYKPFLTKYYHQKESFPTANEIAQYFDDFNSSKSKTFKKIKCKMESFGYKALQDKNNNLILCEEIAFNI